MMFRLAGRAPNSRRSHRPMPEPALHSWRVRRPAGIGDVTVTENIGAVGNLDRGRHILLHVQHRDTLFTRRSHDLEYSWTIRGASPCEGSSSNRTLGFRS